MSDRDNDRPFSVYDHVRTPRSQRSLGRLPGLALDAMRLVRRAAPREFTALLILQSIGAVGLAGQLLLGKEVISAAIAAESAGNGLGTILPQLCALVALTAVVGVVTSLQSDRLLLLAELVGREAQGAVLDVSSAVDYADFEDPSFHNGLERARYNAGARPTTMVTSLLQGMSAGLGALGLTIGVLAIQPLLVPLAIAALVPVWLATTGNSKAYYDFAVAMTPRDRLRTYIHHALSTKDAAAEVRVFQLAPFLRGRHDALYDERIDGLREVVKFRMRRSLVAGAISFVLTALAGALVIGLLLDHRLTLAAAATGVWGVALLGQRLRALVASAGTLYESALFISDVTEFLGRGSGVARPDAQLDPPTRFEQLRVDSVTFEYPGARRPTLRDISFEIRRGEVVALVGENGSGKTTLAKILAGLYTPSAGQVVRDGTPEADWDADKLRSSVAVIFQDFAKYAMSARDNVGMGRIEFNEDLDRIVSAAELASAHEFLADLPEGYDTVLSRMFDGGRELSIGQWQRVAIARAFFRDAPFVIMDEPTASLDPVTERDLFEQIGRLSDDRALLLISHRFSSMRSADRIYVMHEGEIVEHGSHEELMELDGRYARLFRLQAETFLTDESNAAIG
jgi:ATP-binding cassette, subfamily B, bacterial